ncbi:hypothetical protein A8926_6123 [Saccharopolyspora spinosa]|uniref:Uncharacterized protein n=2 Tax=Saccharopolyspora spinosa TaxID=60894 RepID=A0A2N3Y575_SACSN|nr:hypothetical protein A8926_6123 [Saccharopolyspora spinosa]
MLARGRLAPGIAGVGESGQQDEQDAMVPSGVSEQAGPDRNEHYERTRRMGSISMRGYWEEAQRRIEDLKAELRAKLGAAQAELDEIVDDQREPAREHTRASREKQAAVFVSAGIQPVLGRAAPRGCAWR